jgi:hypothetical protein
MFDHGQTTSSGIKTGKFSVGRALFTAIDQFAASEDKPELKTAPLIAMGWSGAGSLAGRLAGYRPERYLAGIAYAPGQYDPLGMDTIELSREAIRKPQLIIANGSDNVNGTERPYAYFRKYFDQGAPWRFVVQNRTPHCCLQNAQTLILDWLHGVLTTEPKTKGAGDHGYLTVELSQVTDESKRPVFNARSSRIGAKAEPDRKSCPRVGCRQARSRRHGFSLSGEPRRLQYGSPESRATTRLAQE